MKISAMAALAALLLLSLKLTGFVNHEAGVLLRAHAPHLAWIASAAIPSCLAALIIYLAIRPRRRFSLPASDTDWSAVIRISVLWLLVWFAASVVIPFWLGSLTPYASGAALIAAFIVFGPLGEELLFRGAIFEVTQRAFPQSRLAPVLISSIFFSLHHFQLHADSWSAAALGQVAFTFPMGLVFGRLRQLSYSLWPALALHMLTNAMGLLG